MVSITVLTESGFTTLLLSEISAVTVELNSQHKSKDSFQVHLKSGTIFTIKVKQDYTKLYDAWMRSVE